MPGCEERLEVMIPTSKLRRGRPAVPPQGRGLTAPAEVSRAKLPLWLFLRWLKQKGLEVVPVRTHSYQEGLHGNEPHLCKHQGLAQVHMLCGLCPLQIPVVDLMLLLAGQGEGATQCGRL